MLFSSFIFIFAFLPAVLVSWYASLYFGRPRVAVALCVAASLFFYGYWNPSVFWVLTTSIIGNYLLGNGIVGLPPGRRRKALLIAGLTFDLGLLGWFKYAGFVGNLLTASNFRDMTSAVVNTALPLGISFFTFQKVAYLIDCYRKPPTRNYSPLEYAFFVTFFPQLIAGPIVHHSQMIPQLWRLQGTAPLRRAMAMVPPALALFTIGLAKKLLLADSFGRFVGNPFANASSPAFSFLDAWGAALTYTMQIYFDFSGYSDMAIGLGLLFGIRLPINFFSPYKATSIIDFWRRWHMTLSTFLRDYLYFALGGNRNGPVRRHVNLLVTMVLGGLWHGPSLTFLVWGLLHGLYLVFNHLWRAVVRWRMPRLLATVITFMAVVIAWVPFRAANLVDCGRFYRAMLGLDGVVVPSSYQRVVEQVLGATPPWMRVGDLYFFAGAQQIALVAIGLVIVFALPSSTILLQNRSARRAIRQPAFAAGLGAMFWVSLVVLFGQDSATFLYFQF